MSDYTTEAEVSVNARKKRRQLIVLGVVVLGLFFAFWYAWSYYQADNSARASRPPAATCAPYDPKVVTPANTRVNVYNASDRVGLAGSVSRSLRERGFVIGKVANDPSSRKAPKVAEIRYGAKGDGPGQAAAHVAAQGHQPWSRTSARWPRSTSRSVRSTPTLAPVPTTTAMPMCPAPSALLTGLR